MMLLTALFVTSSVNAKINTVSISASTLSPDCIEYRIAGICYWLLCTPLGCTVKTSVKVKHYVPDAVVSSYVGTGDSPWTETAIMGTPVPGAQSGSYATTNQANENAIAKFNNVDVIGHPSSSVFNSFFSSYGYSCQGADQSFIPYFISTLDTVAWRYNVPEVAYPESLVPGTRESVRELQRIYGAMCIRVAVLLIKPMIIKQRQRMRSAGDIVTRHGQPHVYQPLLASKKDGYWPAGELVESKASTGKWQALTPKPSSSCQVFPDNQNLHEQAEDGAYAWALWRPYSCCKRRGQTFLYSIDF